jgi:flagellar hook-associated protein 3 FlgL
MAIDRVGTYVNAQVLMSQVLKSEATLDKTNKQVASGNLSDTYTGYGAKTAALEAARSAAARADANVSVAQQASTRLDLQDTQLTQLAGLVDQVRQALTGAIGTGDGSALMGQLSDLFDQAVTILNAKDGSGYIYGGQNDQTPPVTVSSLSDLAALPSVSAAFANGDATKSARIGENRTVQVGMLASDLGTQLFTLLRDVAQFDAGASGPFGATLTPAQNNFIQTSVQTSVATATAVNAQAAANGDRYRMVQDAIKELQATSTVYKGFVSNIQDVDMGAALAQLNQNQVALQAAFKVASTMNQLSLLNYLPQN